MITTKKKSNIVLGSVSATEEELHLKDAKVRITMMVDLPVLKRFKDIAQATGAKYQTLMNQKLKESLAFMQDREALDQRVTQLEKLIYSKKRTG